MPPGFALLPADAGRPGLPRRPLRLPLAFKTLALFRDTRLAPEAPPPPPSWPPRRAPCGPGTPPSRASRGSWTACTSTRRGCTGSAGRSTPTTATPWPWPAPRPPPASPSCTGGWRRSASSPRRPPAP
ncbi:MAG: hypothetical protein R3F43_22795 [bacterium]